MTINREVSIRHHGSAMMHSRAGGVAQRGRGVQVQKGAQAVGAVTRWLCPYYTPQQNTVLRSSRASE